MSVNLRDLARLVEETNASPIVLTLTSPQISAVEIYVLDDAHEEEPWYGKTVLRDKKLTLNMTYREAVDMFIDVSNSADAGDGSTPDREAARAIDGILSKLKTATGQAVPKQTRTKTTSKLKTLRSWIMQAVNKPGTARTILLNPSDYKTWAGEDGKSPDSPYFTLSTANGELQVYPSHDVRPNEYKLR